MRVLGWGVGFGFVAIAALAIGCGNSVRNYGEVYRDPCWASVGGCDQESDPDPQPIGCEEANEGAPCLVPGEQCSSAEWDAITHCGDDHHWHITYYGGGCDEECCDGPGEYCPDAPRVGDFCDPCYDGTGCTYAVDIGCGVAQGVSLSCDPNSYTWQVDEPACALPPDACALLATSDECAADDACRWLEPGCDTPALAAPGCFAASDCFACGVGATCTQVAVVGPCPGADCGACAARAWVCQ